MSSDSAWVCNAGRASFGRAPMPFARHLLEIHSAEAGSVATDWE